MRLTLPRNDFKMTYSNMSISDLNRQVGILTMRWIIHIHSHIIQIYLKIVHSIIIRLLYYISKHLFHSLFLLSYSRNLNFPLFSFTINQQNMPRNRFYSNMVKIGPGQSSEKIPFPTRSSNCHPAPFPQDLCTPGGWIQGTACSSCSRARSACWPGPRLSRQLRSEYRVRLV